MASDDLRVKLRRILAEADGFDPDMLDPNDYEHADQILALFQPELDVLRGKVTALEASYEVVAADAMAHGMCSLKRHSLLQRAEKAEAELERLAAEPNADHSDRCPRCWCGDCGGRLDEHTESGCGCESCQLSPSLACSLDEFLPDAGIGYIAEQLGPLLSVHLGEKQQQRCLTVAHAANHALRDYDQQQGADHG